MTKLVLHKKKIIKQMHIVHIKEGYTGIEDIKYVRDGLLVLGVFLEVDPNLLYNQCPYSKLFNAAPKHMNGRVILSLSFLKIIYVYLERVIKDFKLLFI